LELPSGGLPWDPRRHASPECWRLYGEVQGFELDHVELVRDHHQLAVDGQLTSAMTSSGMSKLP
jgi:hypothetical protein